MSPQMNLPHGGAHLLVAHRDIQDWVAQNHGSPAVRRVPDVSGGARSQLSLRFKRPTTPRGAPMLDDGAAPCSWTAWFAELDRQRLAVRITDPQMPGYELVPRN